MLRAVIAALLVALAPGSVKSDETMTIDVGPLGRMQGTVEHLSDDRSYVAFRGLPYALPPVGNRRFKDPEAIVPWNGLRFSMDPPKCPQNSMVAMFQNLKDIHGDEDCLYLNVYMPNIVSPKHLPVMVFIHGGGLLLGDADMFGGTPRKLMTKDVVLVSIQYRLGTLGFMSTGDSVMPGNLGLKDQTMALKWVQRYIGNFNGDPERITIFGESAGAASVHFHIFSPASKGLFHRAIMQSGTAISSWSTRDDHAEIAKKVGQALNCPVTNPTCADSSELLDCFKKASVEDLIMIPQQFTSAMGLPFLMVARDDGDYLPAHPAQLLKEGRYHNVDIISGMNKDESVASSLMFTANETLKMEILQNFDAEVPVFVGLDMEDNAAHLTRRLFFHYIGEIDFPDDKFREVGKMLSDAFMLISHDEATSMHARSSKYGAHTYRYELQHHGEQSFVDLYKSFFNTTKQFDFSEDVAHGDELQYLFNNVTGLAPTLNRPDDIFLSEIMLSLWTNFAKTGNPTPDLALGFKWEPMTSESDFRFLSLIPAARMKEDNRKEIREFWRDLPTKHNKLMHPERFRSDLDSCHKEEIVPIRNC